MSKQLICEQCEQKAKKLLKFRSSQVCADCEEILTEEETEFRGRSDCAQSRINDGFYELYESMGE